MNETLQSFAREWLKKGLAKVTPRQQELFKLMYGRKPGINKRSVEESLSMDINDLVDEMSANKLDWAMQQVENGLKTLENNRDAKEY